MREHTSPKVKFWGNPLSFGGTPSSCNDILDFHLAGCNHLLRVASCLRFLSVVSGGFEAAQGSGRGLVSVRFSEMLSIGPTPPQLKSKYKV